MKQSFSAYQFSPHFFAATVWRGENTELVSNSALRRPAAADGVLRRAMGQVATVLRRSTGESDEVLRR
jgi:hypothetical protein